MIRTKSTNNRIGKVARFAAKAVLLGSLSCAVQKQTKSTLTMVQIPKSEEMKMTEAPEVPVAVKPDSALDPLSQDEKMESLLPESTKEDKSDAFCWLFAAPHGRYLINPGISQGGEGDLIEMSQGRMIVQIRLQGIGYDPASDRQQNPAAVYHLDPNTIAPITDETFQAHGKDFCMLTRDSHIRIYVMEGLNPVVIGIVE